MTGVEFLGLVDKQRLVGGEIFKSDVGLILESNVVIKLPPEDRNRKGLRIDLQIGVLLYSLAVIAVSLVTGIAASLQHLFSNHLLL